MDQCFPYEAENSDISLDEAFQPSAQRAWEMLTASNFLLLGIATIAFNIIKQPLKVTTAAFNALKSTGATLLYWDLKDGDASSIAWKLAHGWDVNYQDQEGAAPLHYAVDLNQPDCLSTLLKANPQINLKNNAGNTPLHIAAYKAPDCIPLLLRANADTRAQNNNGNTPLHFAVGSNQPNCTSILLEANPTAINIKNKEGNTPLHHAVLTFASDCIPLLLGANTNTEAQNDRGNTPLHYAVDFNQPNYTSILLKANPAAINIKNNEGNTPLHYAAYKGPDCIPLLLGANADTGAQNNNGNTPLHFAVGFNQPDCTSTFLKANSAAINTKNNEGNTPLHYAVLNHASDCIPLLLDANADIINAQNENGDTPLHIAVLHLIQWEKSSAIIRLFLDHPEKIYTCIHILLAHGAQLNIQNNDGKTPNDLLVENGLKHFIPHSFQFGNVPPVA